MFSQLMRQKRVAANDSPLTIRHATAADAERVARLAELDSSPVPQGELLLAEVGGELWAALSIDEGHAIGDPFRPSSEAVWMLAERSRQIRRGARRRERRGRPRLRLA